MKGLLFVGLALSLGACGFLPMRPEPGGGGMRRTGLAEAARRSPPPILRPVRNHVSDSIPDAFPALDAPVADEAIYGPGARPERVMRARLAPPGSASAEDVPDAPRVGRLALAPPAGRE